ncbi:MAG: rhomboid family intramembrane serine protease [Bacteroidetes bacterium]|nr:MAG: rhomboid family intramembrane serine protease [Bacteroidota bacterium]TAG87918.1 MAG: rhomboid family intramembrane serine protease [Bacteroidota bacterium]
MKPTPIVRNLLIANILIFLLQELGNVPFIQLFKLHYIASPDFQPWQLLTYMFLHAGIHHLFSNMLSLFFFGPWIENTLGSRRFIPFYFICGMGAALINFAIIFAESEVRNSYLTKLEKNPTEENFVAYLNAYHHKDYVEKADKMQEQIDKMSPEEKQEQAKELKKIFQEQLNYYSLVGASGAVFGILMAFMLLFPNVELMLFFFPVPIKAKYLIGLYIIYELFMGTQYSNVSNVAHFAHLGGALMALILIKIWKIKRIH